MKKKEIDLLNEKRSSAVCRISIIILKVEDIW